MMDVFLKHKDVMLRYLDAFNAQDMEGVLLLFSKNAVVHSPTRPDPVKPHDFYPALFEKSQGSKFVMKAVFGGEHPDIAAILFDYNKPMPGGGMNVFDCVDIFSFDAENRIKEMWIIFDTKNLTKA